MSKTLALFAESIGVTQLVTNFPMRSFEDKLNQLLRLLGSATSNVDARQGDWVFNLHYRPEEWAEIRGQFPKLKKRLESEGYSPEFRSFADIIRDILENEGAQPIEAMCANEAGVSLPHEVYTQTLQSLLLDDPSEGGSQGEFNLRSPIVQRILAIYSEISDQPKPILVLQDLEMLHPLVRVSAFEQVMQGRFAVPTVFLYPGEKGDVGDNPRFLGFYKSDGNYRSTHIY